MKKRALGLALIMMWPTVNIGFAEKLDDSYINMFVEKFELYTPEQKEIKVQMVESLMGTDAGLEVLYYKALQKESEFPKYNLSREDVKDNINALGTWSVSDRYDLVDAAEKLDIDGVKKINDKNEFTTGNPIITDKPDDGDTTGNPAGEIIGEVILEENMPKGNTLSDILKNKGFLFEEAVEIEKLRDKKFEDTTNHWSNEAVLFLAKRGMINGRTTSTFVPGANVTKAETVKLVMNLIVSDSSKISKSEDILNDVSQSNWFSDDVRKAISLGIIAPSEYGLIDPSKELTREEVIEIIVKSMNAMEIEIGEELKANKGMFTDFESVTESRKESIAIAYNLGVISGMGDGTVAPKDTVTRAQIAMIMKNYYKFLIGNLHMES